MLDDETDWEYSLSILKGMTNEYRPIVPFLSFHDVGFYGEAHFSG